MTHRPLWIKVCGLRTAAIDAAVAAGRAKRSALSFTRLAAPPRSPPKHAPCGPVPHGIEKVAVFLHPTTGLDRCGDRRRATRLGADGCRGPRALRLPPGQRVLPVYRTGRRCRRAAPAAAIPARERAQWQRRMADWDDAAPRARSEVVLAGGLDASNVAAAIEAVRPFGDRRELGRRRHSWREEPVADQEFVQAARASHARHAPSAARAAEEIDMQIQALKIDREALLAQTLHGEFPDARGRFGPFGGRYVPETLVPALDRLEQGIRDILPDPAFKAELDLQLRTWVGRPTPLSFAAALSRRWGAEVWLKREDLAHTGAHKINNAIGQALLAKRLGASGSSLRPAPASMGSRPRPRAPGSACPAPCTWVRSTWSDRRRTSAA